MDLHAISYANISNYIPKIGIVSPQQTVKNLTKLAVPVIALAATSMVNGAQAIKYNECFENCGKHRDAHELAILLCQVLCFFFADKK